MFQFKKTPTGKVPPMEVRLGERFGVDGVTFKCIGAPKLGGTSRLGNDPDFVYIPVRKFRARQIRPVPKGELVDIFRS